MFVTFIRIVAWLVHTVRHLRVRPAASKKGGVQSFFGLPWKRPRAFRRHISHSTLFYPLLQGLVPCCTSCSASSTMADVLPPPTRPPPTPRTNADFRALLETPRANRGGETPNKGQQKPAAQKKRPPRPKPKPETEATDDEPRYRYVIRCILATCCMGQYEGCINATGTGQRNEEKDSTQIMSAQLCLVYPLMSRLIPP